MDGGPGGNPETGGDWSIMCGLHFPPRNAHAVQPGTAHLPPPWQMHRLLDRASVVHPGFVQGTLLCRLRMPPDRDTGLQPGGGGQAGVVYICCCEKRSWYILVLHIGTHHHDDYRGLDHRPVSLSYSLDDCTVCYHAFHTCL